MTKSFLIIAALTLSAPLAMAQVQNAGPQGSSGGNNVGAAVAPAASAPAQTPAASADTGPRQVQNAGPQGSAGGNNVGASVTPAPAQAAPARAPAASANTGAMAHSQTMGTVDPTNYKTETECLNAAQAAHAPSGACMSLPKN
jgi:hypothetical protein